MIEHKDTRWLLYESLCDLCKTKRVDKITVSDITSNCGMKRGIFYYYFKDKEDMILTMMELHAKGLYEKGWLIEDWKSVIMYNLKFCSSSRELMRELGKSSTRMMDETGFNMNRYMKLLLLDFRQEKVLDSRIKGLVDFYCAGATAIYKEWINGNFVEDIQDVANFLDECMPEKLKEMVNCALRYQVEAGIRWNVE